jgi:hypothetical protein
MLFAFEIKKGMWLPSGCVAMKRFPALAFLLFLICTAPVNHAEDSTDKAAKIDKLISDMWTAVCSAGQWWFPITIT